MTQGPTDLTGYYVPGGVWVEDFDVAPFPSFTEALGQMPREFQVMVAATTQLEREFSAINAAFVERHFARRARIRRMHQQYARRRR